MKEPRILPALLSSLTGLAQDSSYSQNTAVAYQASGYDDRRIVPTLMSVLLAGQVKDNWSGTSSFNEVRITRKQIDGVIYVVLRLTRQGPADYGFISHARQPGEEQPEFGFPDDKDQTRQAALEKLKAWWNDHKIDFEGVDTIPLIPPPPAEGC